MILSHAVVTNYPLPSQFSNPMFIGKYSLEWQILPVEQMTNRQVVAGETAG
jgi:hypothetical protein